MTRRILITGAGGAAAVALIRAFSARGHDIFVADMDPHASGLYLVPAARRALIPRAESSSFVQGVLTTCHQWKIDTLIPTVDAELVPLAENRERFERLGIRTMLASATCLKTVLDKKRLMEAARFLVPTPRTAVVAPDTKWANWPAIVKPRAGSGSRGVRRVVDATLADVPRDGSYLIQEELPGAEYSVDVLADPQGRPLAAVPRHRLKIDSGVAVAATTLRDPELEEYSNKLVHELRLPFVSNVQWKRDRDGRPKLLEINPRFPGTMPLTRASGIDMPNLALDLLWDRPVRTEHAFRPVTMVRTWQETYLSPDQLSNETWESGGFIRGAL